MLEPIPHDQRLEKPSRILRKMLKTTALTDRCQISAVPQLAYTSASVGCCKLRLRQGAGEREDKVVALLRLGDHRHAADQRADLCTIDPLRVDRDAELHRQFTAVEG